MSLVMAVSTIDGMAVVCDGRKVINEDTDMRRNFDNTCKVELLSSSRVAVGFTGNINSAKEILAEAASELNGNIEHAVLQLQHLARDNYKRNFPLTNIPIPRLVLLVCGRNTDGKNAVYSLDSNDQFVPNESCTGVECWGVSKWIPVFNYVVPSTIERAFSLCAWAINHTGKMDNSVGGDVSYFALRNGSNAWSHEKYVHNPTDDNCIWAKLKSLADHNP